MDLLGNYLPDHIAKAINDGILPSELLAAEKGILEKAGRVGLVKKVIIDKNGKRTTRWVRANAKPTSPKRGSKKEKVTKKGGKLESISVSDYEKLSPEDRLNRNIKVYKQKANQRKKDKKEFISEAKGRIPDKEYKDELATINADIEHYEGIVSDNNKKLDSSNGGFSKEAAYSSAVSLRDILGKLNKPKTKKALGEFSNGESVADYLLPILKTAGRSVVGVYKTGDFADGDNGKETLREALYEIDKRLTRSAEAAPDAQKKDILVMLKDIEDIAESSGVNKKAK